MLRSHHGFVYGSPAGTTRYLLSAIKKTFADSEVFSCGDKSLDFLAKTLFSGTLTIYEDLLGDYVVVIGN
jgi:hypothetical protein